MLLNIKHHGTQQNRTRGLLDIHSIFATAWGARKVTIELSSRNDGFVSNYQIMHVDPVSGPSSSRMASSGFSARWREEKLKARRRVRRTTARSGGSRDETCVLSNIRRNNLLEASPIAFVELIPEYADELVFFGIFQAWVFAQAFGQTKT